jgi:hypothetical protein
VQARRQGRDHGDPPLSKLKRWRVVRVVEAAKIAAQSIDD